MYPRHVRIGSKVIDFFVLGKENLLNCEGLISLKFTLGA